MKSSISILFFMKGASSIVPKKSSPHPRWSKFPLILSPRSFKVFHFMFRSTTYFELLFVKGVSSVPYTDLRFRVCTWMSNCSGVICCKDHLCSILLPGPLDWRSVTIFVEPICVLYSSPLIYMFGFGPVSHYFAYWIFLVRAREHDSSIIFVTH